MSDMASTACRRCRQQKLRCSRETPACARCLRLHAVCSYPPPPDRKTLATFRANPRKRNLIDISSLDQLERNDSSPSTSPQFPTKSGDDPQLGLWDSSELNLSEAAHKLFQETYFACMFHSTLIFHPNSFYSAFRTGELPMHTILAVYATATIFLRPPSTLAETHIEVLRPLGDLRALGKKWALRASREVLQEIDQPSLDKVQTCEVLTLYWFGVGDPQRNTMFSGIAYKAACTLGLDRKEYSYPNRGSEEHPDWHNAEIARRCFWAVWFTQCINADHGVTGMAQNERIMKLPLPIGERSFLDVAEQSPLTLSDMLNRPPQYDTRLQPTDPSVMAELMTLMFKWADIRSHIQSINRVSPTDWLAKLFEIEGQLSRWASHLHESFRYTKRNLYEQLVVNQQPVYVYIHALYHQCRLVLHSSLVPKFGGLRLPEAIPLEATSLCARLALTSAQRLSELGADLLALDWHPSQIPSFVGYCMYVSASIHITLLSSRDMTLVEIARKNLISSLRLLTSTKMYWTNLERLWIRINVLYDAQMTRHRSGLSEPGSGSSAYRTELNELDHIARETRDTGALSEPLANSVLQYSLRQLKPDAQPGRNILQDLERSPHAADLVQLLDCNMGHLAQPASGVPTMSIEVDILPSVSDTSASAFATLNSITASTDWTRGHGFSMEQSNHYDWGQLNPDSLLQPFFSYDDLFNLNVNI